MECLWNPVVCSAPLTEIPNGDLQTKRFLLTRCGLWSWRWAQTTALSLGHAPGAWSR